jgi:hypothetical protein
MKLQSTAKKILKNTTIGIVVFIVIALLVFQYQNKQSNSLRLNELEKLTTMAMSIEKQNIKLAKHHGVFCLIYDKSGNIFIQRKGKLVKVGSIEKIKIKGKD